MTIIEAYASRTSVFAGQSVSFSASFDDAEHEVAIEFFRIGTTYELMRLVEGLRVGAYQIPDDADANGCNWPVVYELVVGAYWPSGPHVARFSGGGSQTEVLFVVKSADPGSTSQILMALTVTTAQAYNYWHGGSLYGYASVQLTQVSFDRPTDGVHDFESYKEERFVKWAELHGISLEFCTGIDLHEDADLLYNYRLLVSVGHDEYWSKEMRDNVEAFISAGGNVLFLSGNVCWWQVRFDGSGNRTMICYKTDEKDPNSDPPPQPDPIAENDPTRDTIHWFDLKIPRPEAWMTGVSFRRGAFWSDYNDMINQDRPSLRERRLRGYRVRNADHWVFAGTGLLNDDEFGASNDPNATYLENIDRTIIGYETDTVDLEPGGTPANFTVLAEADLRDWPSKDSEPPSDFSAEEREIWKGLGLAGSATMGIYTRGGTVFTGGTVNWCGGLSLPEDSNGAWTHVDQITLNLLGRLGGASAFPLSSGCLVAESHPAGSSSAVLNNLRVARDKILRGTPWGATLFERFHKHYYSFSTEIAGRIKADPEMRKSIGFMIAGPLINYLRLVVAMPRFEPPELECVSPPFREFLRVIFSDLDRWLKDIDVGSNIAGLTCESAAIEIALALRFRLRSQEQRREYLDELVRRGELPLRGDAEDMRNAGIMMRALGAADDEIRTVGCDTSDTN